MPARFCAAQADLYGSTGKSRLAPLFPVCFLFLLLFDAEMLSVAVLFSSGQKKIAEKGLQREKSLFNRNRY
jgi:hypothetical protein